MEHVIADYMQQVRGDRDWLYEGQHGFRPGYLCESQLITVCQDISDSLDETARLDTIIIDMKMEHTKCSKTVAYKIQTSGNYPEESLHHSEHSESLKSRIVVNYFVLCRILEVVSEAVSTVYNLGEVYDGIVFCNGTFHSNCN
jgi:hypothetical protein